MYPTYLWRYLFDIYILQRYVLKYLNVPNISLKISFWYIYTLKICSEISLTYLTCWGHTLKYLDICLYMFRYLSIMIPLYQAHILSQISALACISLIRNTWLQCNDIQICPPCSQLGSLAGCPPRDWKQAPDQIQLGYPRQVEARAFAVEGIGCRLAVQYLVGRRRPGAGAPICQNKQERCECLFTTHLSSKAPSLDLGRATRSWPWARPRVLPSGDHRVERLGCASMRGAETRRCQGSNRSQQVVTPDPSLNLASCAARTCKRTKKSISYFRQRNEGGLKSILKLPNSSMYFLPCTFDPTSSAYAKIWLFHEYA
jgi:hypothetical protein